MEENNQNLTQPVQEQVNQQAVQTPNVNQPANQGTGKKPMLIIAVLLILAAVLGGGYYFVNNGLLGLRAGKVQNVSQNINPTQAPVAAPVVSPTPVIVNNSQDLQNALNDISNTNPDTLGTDLNQNSQDASQF